MTVDAKYIPDDDEDDKRVCDKLQDACEDQNKPENTQLTAEGNDLDMKEISDSENNKKKSMEDNLVVFNADLETDQSKRHAENQTIYKQLREVHK